MKYLVALLLIFTLSQISLSSGYKLELKVVFDVVEPNEVLVSHGGNGGWDTYQMNKSTSKDFTFVGDAKRSTFEISIEFRHGADNRSEWINSHKGVNGATVYLNGVQMDESYLIDNNLGGSNFYVKVNDDGSFEFGGGVRKFGSFDKDASKEGVWPFYHTNNGMRIQPAGFKNLVGMMVAIHDTKKGSSSTVEVDYLRLYAVVNGKEVLLYSDDYESGKFTDGGLYIRYPWFNYGEPYNGVKDYHENMNAKIKNGSLVFNPSDNTQRVWHWWNGDWSDCPSNVDHYYVEAKVKITGPAYVHAAIDYWRDRNVDPESQGTDITMHYEAGNSDWYTSSDGWQIIRYSTDK